MDLKKRIRNVPNFPQRGIIFRDIGPLLKDSKAFRYAINHLAAKSKKIKIDKVAGIDARGFILAGVLLVDDVLATGGTMLAAARLVEKLKEYPVWALINYRK